MRAVIQRVNKAEVNVGNESVGKIEEGIVVLLGISKDDNNKDCEYLADKIANLRIFADEKDRMNLSLMDIGGSALVVSQFTLFGDCRKGRRPSYNDAAPPEKAEKLYEYFVSRILEKGVAVETGRFQEMMKISLVNDGPVTILLDSKKHF